MDTPLPRRHLPAGFRPSEAPRVLRALVRGWYKRARSRQELARLGERGRRDIGVRYEDAVREARKPFWHG